MARNTFAEEIPFKQFERYFHIMVHCSLLNIIKHKIESNCFTGILPISVDISVSNDA